MAAKKTKKRNIGAIAIIFVIALITLIAWKGKAIVNKITGKDDSAGNGSNGSSAAPSGSGYKECKSFPLKQGCKSKYIKNIQQALNKKHNAGLDVDGIWGPLTNAALVKYGYPTVVNSKDDFVKIIQT
ncbi:MAG: hypothetical protein KJ607_03215 [Bacteroidetes bacterium]|nr:hypothetical protein [Bacteroidota bacterium]